MGNISSLDLPQTGRGSSIAGFEHALSPEVRAFVEEKLEAPTGQPINQFLEKHANSSPSRRALREAELSLRIRYIIERDTREYERKQRDDADARAGAKRIVPKKFPEDAAIK